MREKTFYDIAGKTVGVATEMNLEDGKTRCRVERAGTREIQCIFLETVVQKYDRESRVHCRKQKFVGFRSRSPCVILVTLGCPVHAYPNCFIRNAPNLVWIGGWRTVQ